MDRPRLEHRGRQQAGVGDVHCPAPQLGWQLTPGPQAVMVASFWIAYVVATRETKFPRWFILFTPLATVVWVAAVGLLLVPDPWGKYVVGSFGTWILFFMAVATARILWNVNDQDGSFHRLQ